MYTHVKKLENKDSSIIYCASNREQAGVER